MVEYRDCGLLIFLGKQLNELKNYENLLLTVVVISCIVVSIYSRGISDGALESVSVL